MECQEGANSTNLKNQYCSTHKKKRSESMLIDDGMGGKCCAPGNECQEKSASETQEEQEKVVCSIHNKSRSINNCIADGRGGYKCAAGMQCQKSASEGGGM